jgi:hypothetical protein
VEDRKCIFQRPATCGRVLASRTPADVSTVDYARPARRRPALVPPCWCAPHLVTAQLFACCRAFCV